MKKQTERRSVAIVVTMLALIGATALLTRPATAAPATPDSTTVTSWTATVTEELYTDGFKKKVASETYDATTQDDTLGVGFPSSGPSTQDSGEGGSSTASGCRRVWVNNNGYTILGDKAYTFQTNTEWCWTRSNQVVKDVKTYYRIPYTDGFQVWKGLVDGTTDNHFYDFSTDNGYPRSAHYSHYQGEFQNCVLKYGCSITTYPWNVIRAYYNGTWAWKTGGN